MGKLLVTGATGTIGTEIVRLADECPVSLRFMARDPAQLQVADGSIAETCQGDYANPQGLAGCFEDVEQLLMLTKPGPDQQEFDRNLIDAAKQSGVTRLIKISALGASVAAASELNRYQSAGEDLLARSGMEYVILRPQFFMQNFLAVSRLIQKKSLFSFPAAASKVAMIDARDIAACVLQIASDRGVRNRIFQLTGPEALSMADAAGVMSDVVGRSITFVPVESDQYLEKLLAVGLPEWQASGLTDIYQDIAQYDGYCSAAVGSLTGQQADSFENFLHRHMNQFQLLDQPAA